MSANIHIKIGDLKGESQDAGHKDEIDVLSWSWGAQGLLRHGGTITNPVAVTKGAPKNLTFKKRVDRCSPDLMHTCLDHLPHKEVILSVRKAGVEPALEYVKIILTDVDIASVDVVQGEGSLFVVEEVVLQYLTVPFEYREQTNKGTGNATQEMEWSWKVKN